MTTSEHGEAGAESQEEREILARTARLVTSLSTLSKKAVSSQDDGDVIGTTNTVARLLEEVLRVQESVELLRVMHARCLTREARALLELEVLLRDACVEKGWRIDGVWPSLYIERAILVDVEVEKRRVNIGSQKLSSFAIPAIMRILQPQVKDLVPKDFSAKAFLSMLVSSHDEVAARQPSPVPIYDVYRDFVIRAQVNRFWRDAVARAFTELSADQFRARLTASLEEGKTAMPEGRTLRLLPPLNPADGLYVYQPAEARFGFVGRVTFLSDTDKDK